MRSTSISDYLHSIVLSGHLKIVKNKFTWKIIGEVTCVTLLKKYLKKKENSWNFVNFIILDIAIYLETSTLI